MYNAIVNQQVKWTQLVVYCIINSYTSIFWAKIISKNLYNRLTYFLNLFLLSIYLESLGYSKFQIYKIKILKSVYTLNGISFEQENIFKVVSLVFLS